MTAGGLVQRSFASMAAGAPLGSTLTIVLADGPWEIGEKNHHRHLLEAPRQVRVEEAEQADPGVALDHPAADPNPEGHADEDVLREQAHGQQT